jgi:hypothetical protein
VRLQENDMEENLVIKVLETFKKSLPLKYDEVYIIHIPSELTLSETNDIINIIRDVYPEEVLFQYTNDCIKIYHLSSEIYRQFISKKKEELLVKLKNKETKSGLMPIRAFELVKQEVNTLPNYIYVGYTEINDDFVEIVFEF